MVLVTAIASVMVMGVMAETANTVKVTKFHQSYPYLGKATVEYTVGGALPANAVAEITINTDDASATFTQKNIVTGANTNVIDFASSFGGVLLLTNASFVVTIGLGGVQLWENGPYWAECNVGAEKPEEYGYYYWWGDTVGYTNTGSGWISVTDGTSFSFAGGTAASTYGKKESELLTAGYIDSAGNLVAAHDAATAHLGSPWRMPTDAEFSALISNCTTTWITTNGVSGRLVTGNGDYADRSVFLPAAGYGKASNLYYAGSYGNDWSSSPYGAYYAWIISFGSSNFSRAYDDVGRFYGRTVRPVRGGTTYTVTFEPGANGSGTQQTAIKTHGAALTLKGVIFTRNGYTQMGWTTSDGGEKAYDIGSSYTANAAITLYPYWVANSGSVQLWENGPYWAMCNVGATKPEEYGYRFWWGDTVGYTNTGSGWISVKDGTSISFADSGTAASTCGKYNSELMSAGYIDSTGNLVAAHDAATAHLGSPWRMPTDAEFSALIDNCTTTWITINGVHGRLVTGKGDYADRSIFLPAAGDDCWSSTPYSSDFAWSLHVDSDNFRRGRNSRYFGQSVRPVRGFAQ